MGVFLQNALFLGCDKASACTAMEVVSKNLDFYIDLEKCRYAQLNEGTQVLMDGDLLGFAPLAKALSNTAKSPVMLLYIYDGDYWGYDFYGGNEEDHFNTNPDYFGPIAQEEKQNLLGNPKTLSKWFPFCNTSIIERYLIHWSDYDTDKFKEACVAYPSDQSGYGDCWQMTDFAAQLGFPWPFDELEEIPPLKPTPTLKEILEQNLSPLSKDKIQEEYQLIYRLPSAFSHDYIRHLLMEYGVQRFNFENETPQKIIKAVNTYRQSVSQPECNPLCQRLSVLAAFCSFWLSQDNTWSFLEYATYEPLYVNYEKPTDIYVLRARAAFANFSKRHRALRDLKRLIEIDPINRILYQAEIEKWEKQEKAWQKQTSLHNEGMIQQLREEKHQEEEKEAKRIQLILEKRRKKKK